jgi:hypothetical protein
MYKSFSSVATVLALVAITTGIGPLAKSDDVGPFRTLKPIIPGKAGARLKVLTIPPGVEQTLIAAPKTTDVYSVSQARQTFAGQILKADVITFQPRTNLVFTDFNVPWVAVVAKSIQFVDPTTYNAIGLDANWSPKRYLPPAQPPQPGVAHDGNQCNAGGTGVTGAQGTAGHAGDAAPANPIVYVIVNALLDQHNLPLPQSLNFMFDVRGYPGGDAGNGGEGATGGNGGSGGPSDWHDPIQYPTDPGCKCGSGDGGYGGRGGQGGLGGRGGDASLGGNLVWDAPQAVLDSLYWSRVFNQGAVSGDGGYSGPSGPSGASGPRGAHTGLCGGGSSPSPLPTPATPVVKAQPGNDTTKSNGTIGQSPDPNVSRFFP